jgi:translation initiation factor IF-2
MKKVEAKITTRQPVVAVMGHIDHGKSTLLDTIRRTNTTDKEAGGITQHIAAYETVHNNQAITFLDTPGHAAFKGIRSRGANIADIAILIVSAEEGVKPQTLEALQHILNAKIPYVVGINKIDSPKANIERTKQSLAENEIYIEGYGGDIPWAAISAKTGEGIPALLDLILLVAEMNTFTYSPDTLATGAIIESNLDPKKGISATLILKNGVVKKGQSIVSGSSYAPVRIMDNYAGKPLPEAIAGMPIRLVGFSSLPHIGDLFTTYETKREAEEVVAETLRKQSAEKTANAKLNSGSDIENTPDENHVSVPVVIKADVAGTLEAIVNEIARLKQERVELKVISAGIGDVTEGDVKIMIGLERAQILTFGVKITPAAKSLAERSLIPIQSFSIIYKLIEWIEEFMKSMKPKVMIEKVTGSAKILKIFSINKDKQVVGGRVLEGEIIVGANIRIVRREAKIGDGKIRELQQQKMKASEAKKGTEFGTLIEAKFEMAPGDVIESITMVEEA